MSQKYRKQQKRN